MNEGPKTCWSEDYNGCRYVMAILDNGETEAECHHGSGLTADEWTERQVADLASRGYRYLGHTPDPDEEGVNR